MKQFSLEEYLKNPSRKVVTRDGRSVIIHCVNHWTDYNETPKPIVAEIQGIGFSESFTEYGKYYTDHRESKRDLFFALEKHEGWVNLYNDYEAKKYCSIFFLSEEEAKQNRMVCANYITTVKIEWEE